MDLRRILSLIYVSITGKSYGIEENSESWKRARRWAVSTEIIIEEKPMPKLTELFRIGAK